MNQPEFLIAGGHKCATTSIFAGLGGHPGVRVSSVKEPHYLARAALESRLHTGVWRAEEYQKLWEGGVPGQVRGEASVMYLSFADEVVQHIHAEFDVAPRVIVSVRNPVDRAYSSYLDERLKNPQETAPTFEMAVERERARGPERVDGPESPAIRHLGLGFYSQGIAILRAALGPDRVKVVVFDDFLSDPDAELASILTFLGLDPDQRVGEPPRENTGRLQWDPRVARVARSSTAVRARRLVKTAAPGLHAAIRRSALSRMVRGASPMSQETRTVLLELYRNEIDALETLLGRSLAHWKA